MSATRPVILDKQVQYPTRVKLTNVSTSAEATYDVTAVPGTITVAGTVINAALFDAIMDYIDDVKKDTMLAAHPVGSIYESFDSTEPSVLFGGTWTACGAGRMLVAVDGSTYVGAGETGGSSTHTNTEAEMFPHAHNDGVVPEIGVGSEGTRSAAVAAVASSGTRWTTSVGGGQEYSIMNPYITVYRWRRVS